MYPYEVQDVATAHAIFDVDKLIDSMAQFFTTMGCRPDVARQEAERIVLPHVRTVAASHSSYTDIYDNPPSGFREYVSKSLTRAIAEEVTQHLVIKRETRRHS